MACHALGFGDDIYAILMRSDGLLNRRWCRYLLDEAVTLHPCSNDSDVALVTAFGNGTGCELHQDETSTVADDVLDEFDCRWTSRLPLIGFGYRGWVFRHWINWVRSLAQSNNGHFLIKQRRLEIKIWVTQMRCRRSGGTACLRRVMYY